MTSDGSHQRTSPTEASTPSRPTSPASTPSLPSPPASPLSGPTDADGVPPFSHRQILEIVWALLLCLFVSSLSATVVGTALPTIVGELGGQDQLAWVASSTLLTTTVSTPLWGKLSDLYGRKPLMQIAIALFVVTSILAGLADTMGQLIAARAVQGAGMGGVVALSQATMADIVSPRERGRYAGYLGASFGVATVAGPLIGGFLVDGPGWRWCFYVGIPVAVVAAVVLQRTLHLPVVRRKVRIDWWGATFVTTAATSLLLLLSLAGNEFAWVSGWSAGLVALTLAGLVAAIFTERRAADPILPPRLFRNPTFRLTGFAGFLVGFAMFGAMIYLPQYLQVVRGLSPTASGLLTIPLVISMLVVSVVCGKAITRWGRWKLFPLAGLLLVASASALLSTLRSDTDLVGVCAYMTIFGAGLGLTMQVLVLAIQNTCERRDLGIATSSAMFFRMMGGAMGVSLFGAILTARITTTVPEALTERGIRPPPGDSLSGHMGTPTEIGALPEPLRTAIRDGFTLGLDHIYLLTVLLVLLGFAALLGVKEVPLRGRVRTEETGPVD
jgi:EmrB/QacA subfamily drug resistance transporter